MKTFNKSTQRKYIDRAIKHRKADEIIKGLYWKDGKGCCVGCLAHANDEAHEALEKQTGIPEWLSWLADSLFEGLDDGEYQTFPERFITAMPKNKTPEYMEKNVKAPFIVYILEGTLKNFDHEKFPDIKKSVEGSIELWKREDIGSTDWSAARSAADSAADSVARSVAYSVADSVADSAARSVAYSVAASVAYSVAYLAADSAARSVAYKDYADKLIEIMEML